MKKKSNLITIISTIVVLCTFIFVMNKSKLITTNSSGVVLEDLSKISNKKIAWGIKRADNHDQPDIGNTNKTIIDKYNGICIGNKESKQIYLTFDAGYEAGYMPKILEVLKENNVKATFFITAHYLNTQPELVKRMIEDGHTIGNHTVNHKSMPEIDITTIKDEVMKLHTAVYEKFGYEMKYLRPPKGEFSERTINYTNSLGYTTVMWSLAYDDWDENKQGREDYGRKKVMDNVHNGAVILLHSNSKDNSNILDDIIKQSRQMGYEFKSLDEFER